MTEPAAAADWATDAPTIEPVKHEEEAKKANELSEHALHPHHRLAQSMTLVQIAIALASITVLTKKRWLLALAGAAAAGGMALWVLAYAA